MTTEQTDDQENLPAVAEPKPEAETPRQQRSARTDIKAGAPVRGLIPQTIEEAARLAEGFFRSGMTPDSYVVATKGRDDKGNVVDIIDERATLARLLIGILKGMEVGLPPVAAISTIYIVNNKPSIYGDGALALVQNSDKYEWHREEVTGTPKTDDWKAICTIKRKGIDEPIIRQFSWADAKAAGLSGKSGPWSKYTRRQMQMRARAWAMRDGFSDVLMGLGIAEEVADFDTSRPEPPAPEAQQDAFTMRAIENKPAATVDFSTLQKPEPVAASNQEEKINTPAPEPEPKTVCAACEGKGTELWTETDSETGEIDAGIGPCSACGGKG